MLKSAYILIIFTFFYSKLFSQEDKKAYQIISNNPENPKNLSIGIAPFIPMVFSDELKVSGTIEVSYIYKNIFALHTKYNVLYGDANSYEFNNQNSDAFSVYNMTMGNELDVTGKYFFRRRIKKVDESVHIKFGRESGQRMDYRALIPDINRSYLLGLRAGYINGYTPVIANFDGYNLIDPSQKTESFGGYNMGSFLSIPIGLNFTKVYDLTIKLNNEEKEKGVHQISEYYFDVIFDMRVSYDNMYVPQKIDANNKYSDYQEYKVNNITSQLNFPSFRLGYQYFINKKSNSYGGLEAGIRPALNYWYIQLKYGWVLSLRT